MKNKILLKGLTMVLVAVCTMSMITLNSFAVTQSDVDALKEKAKQAGEELNNISASKQTAQTELESVNSQLETVQNKLAELKTQLSDVNDKISSKESEIAQEEKQIEEKNELLKQRMVALYEAGDTSYLDVLLSSDDLMDFISGYSAIQTIVETDTNLINELEKQQKQLENDKANLEESKQEVENLKNEQEIQNTTLQSLQEKKKLQVASLSADEQAKQAEKDKFTAAAAQGEQEIAKAIAAQKAAAKSNSNSNSGSHSSSSGSVNNSAGTLGWPLPSQYQHESYITSYFGHRKSPTTGASSDHEAIDIGISYQPVYAAESGTVLIASYVSGYGNFIMIKHNGSLYTAYGHLSQYCVSAGDTVSRGEQIAVSGNTGISTGPHLHFEVRSGGAASSNRVDPLNYLVLY